MSEERGKREDGSEDSSTPDSSAPGNTGVGSTPDTGAAGSTGAVRPSGKRTARRRVTGAAESDPSGAKVSVSKSSSSTARASTTRSALSSREVSREPKRMNIFKRLRKFLREVIAELRKVIWPNRKQMVTYTSVVLVFVAFMVAFISGADMAFIRGIEWVFG